MAVFDSDNAIIGNKLFGMEIMAFDELVSFCQNEHVDIIIACTTKEQAENLAPEIIRTGVKGIWNFTHYDFSIYDSSLVVENVHLGDSLMKLNYDLCRRKSEKDRKQAKE